jgi:O-antigen/teichoic acid export membrane protein
VRRPEAAAAGKLGLSVLPKLARDSVLAMLPHVLPRLASVVLFVLLGRLASAELAGVFAIATSYLLIASTILRGLDELVVREVAGQPVQAGRYLVAFTVIRLVLAAGLYGLVWLAAVVIFRYPVTTLRPVLILGLAVLPDGVTYVAQAVLQGERDFVSPAIVLTLVSGLKAGGGMAVLWLGYGVEAVCFVWLLSSLAGMGALLLAAHGRIAARKGWDWRHVPAITISVRTLVSFVALTFLLAFESQTDTLVLSKVRSEAEVGWYGAATTVAFGLLTLSQAYRFSVYPLMARYAKSAPEQLRDFYRNSIWFIFTLALPLSVGLSLSAPQVVRLLFGRSFAASVLPLQILSFALLFLFLNEPNSRMLLVNNRQRQALLILSLTTAANIGLNLYLTPQWGAVGAALSRLGSTVLLTVGYAYYVHSRLAAFYWWRTLGVPIVATLGMAVALWNIRTNALFVTVPIAVLVYVLLLILLDVRIRTWVLDRLWVRNASDTPQR